MGLDETDAWLLHKKPISDNSYYVTFITRQKGVLVALCRTGKKQSILQQFTPLWLSITEKLNRYYVNKIESQGASLHFNKDNLYACLYINELIYYLFKPEDECYDLYLAYEDVLIKLQNDLSKTSIEIILRTFELKLLHAIGYGFRLTLEMESNEEVDADKYYIFIPDRGVVLAQKGILGSHLISIDKCDFRDNEVLKTAKKINRCAIDYCLSGKNLLSRELYK